MKHLALIALFSSGIFAARIVAQTLQKCADFANLYCARTFSTCFEGREYRQVTVHKSHVLADNSVVMAGTVTFVDALGFLKNNYFEMTVTVAPSGMVEVRFSKLNELLGSQYWEHCNNVLPPRQQEQPAAYQPTRQPKHGTVLPDDYFKKQETNQPKFVLNVLNSNR